MSLYRFILWLLRVFSHLYFVEVRALNTERIPPSGPVILAANHPASILDAILMALQTRRQIHFLAKSGLFRNRFVGALLRRVGAIPVYRTGEAEGSSARNVEVFKKVFELFERGGCLGLFPEGRNSPFGQVFNLRSGTARIALGAEARNEFHLGLTIVPVGLTFERRELFLSTVLLRFGQPIHVVDYFDLHRKDPEAAVRQLTLDLQAALRREAMHVEDSQIGELAEDMAGVLGYRIAAAGPEKGALKHPGVEKPRSRMKRWIWKVLDWYRPDAENTHAHLEARMQHREHVTRILTKAALRDPSSVAALRLGVNRYKDHLQQNELSRFVKGPLDQPVTERLIRLRMTIYALIMAPVALFGLVHNAVPYLVTRFSSRLVKDEAVRAFALFGVGFLAFSATYGGIGFWLWYDAGMDLKWVAVYLALLPPAGFSALRYRRNILVYRNKILVRTFFWNNEELVELLRRERREIIERFRALAET